MKFVHSAKILDDFLLKFRDLSGAKDCKSCRSRKMLKNAPTLAIVAVHTEENEPPKVLKPKISFISFGSLRVTDFHWSELRSTKELYLTSDIVRCFENNPTRSRCCCKKQKRKWGFSSVLL